MTCVIPLEAIGTEMVEAYDECTNLFFCIGWWDFLKTFQGYSQGVVEAFVSSFDGEKAQFGDRDIPVYVYFIVEATRLPIEGEKW